MINYNRKRLKSQIAAVYCDPISSTLISFMSDTWIHGKKADSDAQIITKRVGGKLIVNFNLNL